MKINKDLPWYVTAVLSVGAALAITSLLWPLMSQSVFLFFIFAVGFSAHFRGRWAGLLATGLGILATTFFFFLPYTSWHMEPAKSLIPILIFGALGTAASLLTGAGQKVREMLRETVKVKDESLAQLEALLATAPIGIAPVADSGGRAGICCLPVYNGVANKAKSLNQWEVSCVQTNLLV